MNSVQHAIVTGGMGKIGRAIAQQLHLRGNKVTLFDCLPEDDARVQIREPYFQYQYVDVGSHNSIQEAFNKFFSKLSTQEYLSVLVNNAGITNDKLAIRLSEHDWDSVLDINLKGLFFCAQHALKHMIAKKRGYIINLGSVVGLSGNAGQSSYAASKAGIHALTKTLAQEYGTRSILINAIAPGFINTPMTQKLPPSVQELIRNRIALKRFGEAEEVAHLVDFLTSGKADYITGQIFCIDGGLH